MLTTSMPLSPAKVRASTVGCRKKNPESWPARMLTSVTFGAIPANPDAVQRCGNRSRDVRAVAVVVLVDGIDAARMLARPGIAERATVDVELVGDEVARQRRVEVGRDV